MRRVGILGIGTYLPPEVRRNDWWSPETVARWMDARAKRPPLPPPDPLPAGAQRILQAMAAQARDPFQGTVERRIVPDDMVIADMEERAARSAIERAGIDPSEIDLLLTNTLVPDFLLGNPACVLHHVLGLSPSCFSMQTDIASYAFTMQLSIAQAMIRAGSARCALIVQSCIPSRMIDASDAMSPYFGDAAAAAVIGCVSDDAGIEAAVHFTDGRYSKTLVASVPGGRWYDDGRVVLHVPDPEQAHHMFLGTADQCKQAVDAALAAANRRHGDVDFFCIHQGTPWLRPVVQEYSGLSSARSVETFARTAYVFASSQPICLAFAQEQGQLRDGDLVMLTGGGSGSTYGAIALRWGT